VGLGGVVGGGDYRWRMGNESPLDKQIREAQERGDFDNLPGMGKPLRDSGRPLHEDWWLTELVHREQIAAVLPPALALRKEIEDLPESLARLRSEQKVRSFLEDLNNRIIKAQRAPAQGPGVVPRTVDVEEHVLIWRDRA
jgi:hypothetical protein